MLFGLLSGACWFSVFLLLHVAVFHWIKIQNRFRLIVRLFALAMMGHFALVASVHPYAEFLGSAYRGFAQSFLPGMMTMLCLFVLYMPFYFTIAASLSVQSLILIARAPHGRMPLVELREHFASRQILEQRLETMVRNGYLFRSGERYHPTAKGKLVGRAFQVVKRCWKLGAGG